MEGAFLQSLGTDLHEYKHPLGTDLHECFHALGTDMTREEAVLTPASRSLLPAGSGLGHACSADTGDTDNLLDREMRPPEPQQTVIWFRAWQGLEQRGIYAWQDFIRDDKGILIGNPPARKNVL